MREETKHREAFERYVELGATRSLGRLHDHLQREKADAPSIRTLESWSSEFGWQQRLSDLEREARQAHHQALTERRRETQQRHLQLGVVLQQQGLQSLLARIAADEISAATALRAIVAGVLLEREASGLDEDPPEKSAEATEVHLIMGGDQDLFMYPDPDQDDP